VPSIYCRYLGGQNRVLNLWHTVCAVLRLTGAILAPSARARSLERKREPYRHNKVEEGSRTKRKTNVSVLAIYLRQILIYKKSSGYAVPIFVLRLVNDFGAQNPCVCSLERKQEPYRHNAMEWGPRIRREQYIRVLAIDVQHILSKKRIAGTQYPFSRYPLGVILAP
jgi:hypothetical protein